MDTKQKIEAAQQIIETGGNIIKKRDDRELILLMKMEKYKIPKFVVGHLIMVISFCFIQMTLRIPHHTMCFM